MIRDVHVLRQGGRWAVAVEGASRMLSHHASVEEAVTAGRSWSAWYGGHLLVHRMGQPDSGVSSTRTKDLK
jgi:hypothetical protein